MSAVDAAEMEPFDWRTAIEERHARNRKAAEEASAEFYAENDPTTVREIDWPYPPCPVCDLELEGDGDGWWCDVCCVAWSLNGTHPRRDIELVQDRALDQSPRPVSSGDAGASSVPTTEVGQ